MREARPVIALDFPSFEAVKQFFSSFSSRREPLSKGRYGTLFMLQDLRLFLI